MKNQQAQIVTLTEDSNLFEKFRFWTGDLGGKAVIFFALISLTHLLYLNYHWGGDEYLDIVNDGVSLVLYTGVFLMLLRTSRHEALPLRTKRAWQFFTIAFFGSTVGTALWFYFNDIMKTQPYPSWADPFYLSYYPFMLVGLLLAAPKIQTREERVKLALDGGIVMLGSGMLLWHFVLQPIAQAGTDDQLLTALSLAYPVCDLLMLFGITVVLLRHSAAGINWALNLLLGGIVLMFFADLLFCYQNLNGTYVNGSVADILYSITCLLVILAAHIQFKKSSLEPEAVVQSKKEPKSFNWLPYLAIAAGYGLLLSFVSEQPDSILSQLIIIAVGLTLLVVLRQIMSIRENVKAKEALRELQERFQGIYDSSKDAIAFASFDGRLIDVNDAFASLVGYSEEELINGKTYHQLTPSEYHQSDAEHLSKIIEFDQPAEFEKEYVRKDGTRVPITVTAFTVKGNDGKPMGLAAIIRNITERKRNEEQLLHNALHDALTKLPNRALFLEHLQSAIDRNARRTAAGFAVLFLDLDRFKIINDSLGHMEGDKLLISFAQRLKASLRPGDIVARLGGDEFTILLDGLEKPEDALQVVERIESVLKKPFTLTDREVFTSASIGVAMSSASYTQPEELLRDADIAMYYAKAAGKARHQFFNQVMHERASSRLQLETEMRPAIENKEFCLYYQPIVELESRQIIGFESLVRWQHPERGLIPPVEFIPIAEDSGLIVPLGDWILRESCRQLREWQHQSPANSALTISVNLSCKQFMQIDLADRVAEILEETNLAPEHLRLEVTESNVMDDSELAIRIMSSLRLLGVRLSIDDFGTGYSSLSYLHRLPINYLKIDRSFVTELRTNHENIEIVRTILMLADSLGIEVVAEGIETDDQLEHLKNLDCKNGQGYLFSKPIPPEQIEILLANMPSTKLIIPDKKIMNSLILQTL